MPICERCGTEFRKTRKMNAARFCSWRCYAPAPSDRFWRNVDKRGPDECWPWVGLTRRHFGYGALYVNGHTVSAHRFSYELANGPIPEGEGHFGTCVLHMCDNPPCVNPAHLFLGTHAENAADKARKGRVRTNQAGERNSGAKLTEDQVRAIRASTMSQRKIAAIFGISQSSVYMIRKRKNWPMVA